MHTTPQNLQVLFEDNHLLIVNKRAGDITQGDKTGDLPLSDIIKSYIKEKYQKPGNVFLGTVHRLDRPTSGVVIYARTSKALERLNKMLREKEIKKTYWAVVKKGKIPAKATLEHYLKKNPKNNKSYAHKKEVPGSKKAVLHYETLKNLSNYTLLEVDLETGRHHQIRVQLSSLGTPIKGDLKYGAARSNKNGSIHLHARKIAFTHPVSKELISITAPLPEDPVWEACL
ncbi:RNA pseudouridine synthase [Tenacibaculum litopenaei]|uniref:RluA family pseudouridine synthase n=1 Tax=Tenacibaculum litopenaei TaxID=396016 RepID=UPI0038938D77